LSRAKPETIFLLASSFRRFSRGVRAGYVDLADGFDIEHKPPDWLVLLVQGGKGAPLEVVGVGEE